MHGPSRSTREDDADSAPATSPASVVDRVEQFEESVVALHLRPEAMDFANEVSRERRRREDVVECDHAAGADERPVHLEVAADTLVGVIAVDEQEVDRSAAGAFGTRSRFFG